MLSPVLDTEYTIVAIVAVIVVPVFVIIYYSTSRVRVRFAKKPVKLKFQGSSFCLGFFQCPVLYSP